MRVLRSIFKKPVNPLEENLNPDSEDQLPVRRESNVITAKSAAAATLAIGGAFLLGVFLKDKIFPGASSVSPASQNDQAANDTVAFKVATDMIWNSSSSDMVAVFQTLVNVSCQTALTVTGMTEFWNLVRSYVKKDCQNEATYLAQSGNTAEQCTDFRVGNAIASTQIGCLTGFRGTLFVGAYEQNITDPISPVTEYQITHP